MKEVKQDKNCTQPFIAQLYSLLQQLYSKKRDPDAAPDEALRCVCDTPRLAAESKLRFTKDV
jgi:hypothetical protein